MEKKTFTYQRYKEAHLDLQSSLRIRPEDGSVVLKQARCLYELNRLKESVRHYKRVLQHDSTELKKEGLIGMAKAKR